MKMPWPEMTWTANATGLIVAQRPDGQHIWTVIRGGEEPYSGFLYIDGDLNGSNFHGECITITGGANNKQWREGLPPKLLSSLAAVGVTVE